MVPKMIGIADGLSYLHFNDVVHGDLKGVKVAPVPDVSFADRHALGKYFV